MSLSPGLITAFLTGLISSMHCVAMCGPLVGALPIGRLPQGQRWQAVGLYHAGRIGIYSLLGSLAGTLSFGLYLLGWQRPLAIGCGVILLVSVVGRVSPVRWRWAGLDRWLNTAFRQRMRQAGRRGFVGLGMLNGLLPCGFTYLALAGTLATHTPLEGATYMLLFGAGTLPALLTVNLVAGWLTQVGRQRVKQGLSVATLAVALLLIGRGLAEYPLPVRLVDSIPLCHGLLTNGK